MACMVKLTLQLTLLSALLAVAHRRELLTPELRKEPRLSITASWNEAGALILGHKIAVALPNGAVVEGKVLSLNLDSLGLQVSKTSDSQIQPKGKIVIPRNSAAYREADKTAKEVAYYPDFRWRRRNDPFVCCIDSLLQRGRWLSASASTCDDGDRWISGYLAGWLLDGHHDVTITIH